MMQFMINCLLFYTLRVIKKQSLGLIEKWIHVYFCPDADQDRFVIMNQYTKNEIISCGKLI